MPRPDVTYYIDGLLRQPNAELARVYLGIEGTNLTTVDDVNVVFTDNTTGNSSTTEHGFLPKLSGNASEFLDGLGNWSVPPSGGITQLTGDVTAGPGSGSQAATIPNNTVTYAKMQDVSAASKLLGRGDSGSGDPQEITLGAGLSMSGTTLNSTGGSGTVTNTGTLTDHGVIVGNGGVDVSALAVGATNTVLHGNTGADPSFSAVVEADITLANNTTNDVSITRHGFAPIAPNDATKFLDGTGAYTVPPGTGTDFFWDYMEASLLPLTLSTASFAFNCTRLETATSPVNPTATNPPGMLQRTAGSVNTVSSFRTNDVNQFIYNRSIDIRVIVSTSSDISSIRFWGLMASANAATVSGSDLGATVFCGFRFSTGAGDSNWMCVFNDNAGNSEAISSGVSVVASTTYRLRITWDGTTTGKVVFYINGSSVHTSAFDFPTLSKFLCGTTLTTLANATREFTAYGLKIRQHYP